MQAKAASNWPVFIPAIGSAYEGGFFAGQIGVNGVATHNLVVGPLASAQSSYPGLLWKNANTATAGADSDIDGPQNTADMVADGNSTVYPAAHFCNDLVIGGYTDWYMPAKNELDVCYFGLKPDTTANNTAGTNGVNPNSIPERTTNYTAGTPAQTSVAAFQTGGAEAFTASGYWASTEFSATEARRPYFNNGRQNNSNKSQTNLVRAVRRVPV